jgi:hypothetical protein
MIQFLNNFGYVPRDFLLKKNIPTGVFCLPEHYLNERMKKYYGKKFWMNNGEISGSFLFQRGELSAVR